MAEPITDEELTRVQTSLTTSRVCGVCLGLSPSWDGHDANPPCRGYASRERIDAIFAELRSARATLAKLRSDESAEMVARMLWSWNTSESIEERLAQHPDSVDVARVRYQASSLLNSLLGDSEGNQG